MSKIGDQTMAIISGILQDGLGNPINGTLTLRARGTTSKVLEGTEVKFTTENGQYFLNLFPCTYDVFWAENGYSKKQLGVITVYHDSPDSTLNDYFITTTDGELTPETVKQVIECRDQAMQYRDQAKHYAETIDLSNVLKKGEFGIGSSVGAPLPNPDDHLPSGLYATKTSFFPELSGNNSATLAVYSSNHPSFCVEVLYAVASQIPDIRVRCDTSTGKKQFYIVYTTANTTVDSNGNVKQASPIVQVHGTKNIAPVVGFTQSGFGLVNELADGVTVTRVDVGHYEIRGSLGFAREGWYISLPEDANGNKKIYAEYSVDNNNVITVKTYTRKFSTKLCEIVAGDPIDITDGRWIDLRLEMPVIPNDDNV